MNIAIVGGGINGLCIALEAATRGANVTVFEKKQIMGKTSSASSKLIHGGLRYLENFDIKLVKEALEERAWWLENVPSLTKPIEFHLPIYNSSVRSRTKYKIGLWLYDKLAGQKNIGKHAWLSKSEFFEKNQKLKSNKLIGGFVFYDGQMLDYELGCWVAEQAERIGVKINENVGISDISVNGTIRVINEASILKNKHFNIISKPYDFIINATGSHSEQLLIDSGIKPKYQLDHIRGSHLIVDLPLSHGYFLEVPKEKRIFFVLPYNNQTLIGTTEVCQSLAEPIKCSKEEEEYLINAYNHYFVNSICEEDVIDRIAGIRPLIKSGRNFSKVSREYAIQQNNKLITVYGGKWTTAKSLARHVCEKIKL